MFLKPKVHLEVDHHFLSYLTAAIGLLGTVLTMCALFKFKPIVQWVGELKDLWTLAGLMLSLCGTLWLACGVLLSKNEYLNLQGKKSQRNRVETLSNAVKSAARSVSIGVLYIVGGTIVQCVPLFWERLKDVL